MKLNRTHKIDNTVNFAKMQTLLLLIIAKTSTRFRSRSGFALGDGKGLRTSTV